MLDNKSHSLSQYSYDLEVEKSSTKSLTLGSVLPALDSASISGFQLGSDVNLSLENWYCENPIDVCIINRRKVGGWSRLAGSCMSLAGQCPTLMECLLLVPLLCSNLSLTRKQSFDGLLQHKSQVKRHFGGIPGSVSWKSLVFLRSHGVSSFSGEPWSQYCNRMELALRRHKHFTVWGGINPTCWYLVLEES